MFVKVIINKIVRTEKVGVIQTPKVCFEKGDIPHPIMTRTHRRNEDLPLIHYIIREKLKIENNLYVACETI
jgi:hypothetical protein